MGCGGISIEKDVSVRPSAWRAANLVLLSCFGLLFCGRFIVTDMFANTRDLNWQTPAGSPSVLADKLMTTYFPQRMKGAIVIAVEAQSGTPTVLTDIVANFSRQVRASVRDDLRIQKFDPFVVGYFLDLPGGSKLDDAMRAELVNSDRSMTVIIIQPTKLEGKSEEANAFLEEFCSYDLPGFFLHITGMLAVVSGEGCFAGVHGKVNTKKMDFESLFWAEVLTIPLALLIMSYLVTYVRLLVLPLLTLSVSYIMACVFLLPWMDAVHIAKDVPAAMGSVILALCMDYSLFFLTRFSEHHAEGWPLQKSVDTICRRTGETVAVSGSLVAIAFFSSMVLPEENLRGNGLCMGLAVASCVATSIAVLPAALLVAGKILTYKEFRQLFVVQEIEMQTQLPKLVSDETLLQAPRRGRQPEEPRWVRPLRLMERSPGTVIGLVLLCMSPILLSLPFLRITGDRFALLPMHMPALSAMHRVQGSFPVGFLDPFAVLITAPEHIGADEPLNDVRDGIGGLQGTDIMDMAKEFGLGDDDAAAVAAVLADTQVEMSPDELVKAVGQVGRNCTALTMVVAGVAASTAREEDMISTNVMRSVVHAANHTSCSTSDIEMAVEGAAAVAYATTPVPHNLREDVKSEAIICGLSPAVGDRIAAAAVRGATSKHPYSISSVSASVGKAAGSAGDAGLSHADILRDALLRVEDRRLHSTNIARVGGNAEDTLRKSKHDIESTIDALVDGDANDILFKRERDLEHESHLSAVIVASLLSRVVGRDGALAAASDTSKVADAESPGAEHIARLTSNEASDEVHKRLPAVVSLVRAAAELAGTDRGPMLMPSGFKAMIDLCDAFRGDSVGSVAAMIGPAWGYNRPISWPMAVGLNSNHETKHVYGKVIDLHVHGRHALLEVHTTFPSIGAGSVQWVKAARRALVKWERAHPGYTASLSGGASAAADTQEKVMGSMWSYLGVCILLIMAVVLYAFGSIMVPIRLSVALLFTLAATFGVAVIVYQTPILHPFFPCLRDFDGVVYEAVPMVTGVAIALGLDYDIFLVSRIVEFRLRGFTDKASVFRGAAKSSGVISGAGVIMALAFSGLLFSDKLIFQQFGLLLIVSVLFDTFVVRTVLVPALMLIAEDYNWYPRQMPIPMYDRLEGDVRMDEPYGDALLTRYSAF